MQVASCKMKVGKLEVAYSPDCPGVSSNDLPVCSVCTLLNLFACAKFNFMADSAVAQRSRVFAAKTALPWMNTQSIAFAFAFAIQHDDFFLFVWFEELFRQPCLFVHRRELLYCCRDSVNLHTRVTTPQLQPIYYSSYRR